MDHDVAATNSADDQPVTHPHHIRRRRRDYFLGVGLLLIVVFLWTSSNFITQGLFESGYEKPFLVTYLNTATFAIYLLPWAWRHFIRCMRVTKPSDEAYEPLAVLDMPTSAVLSNPRTPSLFSDGVYEPAELQPLSPRETSELAALFCVYWFIANWSINASLQFTSVSSATILSSTSGFFTLVLGRIFRIERMTLIKVLAVVISFTGVILVSLSDSTTDSHTIVPPKSLGQSVRTLLVFGDILALLSAAFYAIYVILLKVKIKEESRIDMQLFFGFVGLFSLLTLWPIGVILHLAKVEVLALPPSRKALAAVLINMFITWSSDYIYVLAMFRTTPLLVTIGLSLTIPLAIVGDFFLKIPTAPQAILGAILVLFAFICIGIENLNQIISLQSQAHGRSYEANEVEESAENN